MTWIEIYTYKIFYDFYRNVYLNLERQNYLPLESSYVHIIDCSLLHGMVGYSSRRNTTKYFTLKTVTTCLYNIRYIVLLCDRDK